MLGGILLILLGLLFPFITQSFWFNVIFKIRKAISVGDSGHLILASASMCLMYAVQSTSLFLGAILSIYYTQLKLALGKISMAFIFLMTIIIFHIINSLISQLPWEYATTILALVIALLIFTRLFGETISFLQISIVSIQVFFAFQWLNIMPLFSPYYIGQSDIPSSIKTAGLYLEAGTVMNFTGFAFFLPFIASAFITTTLFISYSQNIHIIRENYEKEREIQNIKAKALENRIYKEVKSLVHDLKTPLVTIRGLNSLLAVTKDSEKLYEYSGRIDNSVGKMTEMISSFLYETSKQKLRAAELINYIRAQLPVEDESIKIEIRIEDNLPDIYVNKIRMARAVINILENAILAPCNHEYKQIDFEVKTSEEGILIIVRDNGIGIKEEDMEQIWEVGYSTNNTSGLGLPFAKQIIEENVQNKNHKLFMLGGILLILLGLLFPFITQSFWFNVIFKIRKAISVGDSGHLILASASMCLMYAVQSTSLFLGAILSIYYTQLKLALGKISMAFIFLMTIIIFHIINSLISQLPWEYATTILALVIALLIFTRLFGETISFLQISIVSIQVFFAFQWLNIMPLFSPYYIGQSDIPSSIKTAGLYLEAGTVMNFTGFAFFLPFIASAFITTTLFISYSQNIHIIRENYEKEREIQNIKAKALENRIYKEVKSLVHDLKTPLVTIRGLNSLLAVTKDSEKLYEYSGRIDNSVGKMTEMISSFLYETSKQKLRAAELINYIRAQLPVEDESIRIEINIADDLPDIYVNKIRMARAVINILENSILVPYTHEYKQINFEAKTIKDGMKIIVRDNGIGIKAEDIEHIWKVGYSTNNTSGLGLPFAKQIIEDNEGTITIASEQNQGTVVEIFLPAIESSSN
jgi:signal transduction histidine kinase